MPRKPLTDIALPLLVFPALTFFASKFIFGSLAVAKPSLSLQCPKDGLGLTAFRIAYTGHDRVDSLLCGLVSLFTAAMQPEGIELIYYFFCSAAFLFIMPSIESARKGQGYLNLFITLPVITGLLSQLLTAGIIFPVYWTFFILGGHHKVTKQDAVITRAHAESILFATFVGLGAPSVGMIALQDPQVTAIWQAVPLWVFIAQRVHLLVRRPSALPQSGYDLIKWFYLALFMVASSTHIAALVTKADDLKGFFLPPLTPDKDASATIQVLNFLKWDLVFAFLSCNLASLWFANSATQLAALLVWNVLAIPLAGPGAAFLGVLVWREFKLDKSRGAYGVQVSKGSKADANKAKANKKNT